MKKFLLISFIALFSTTIHAQDFPKVDASPMDAIMVRDSNKQSFMRIIYSRPKKNGRKIFGELVPYGEVWRTGANEATEITFYNKVNFCGQMVDAGTYSLFTIPNKDKWTIILNNDINQWGAYRYNAENDVARVEVTPKTTAANVESFSITSKKTKDGFDLLLGWDDTYVEIPVK
jgi:hypothetical protein